MGSYRQNSSSQYRYFIICLLGFASGLPLALTGSTLEARYASSNVSLQAIGWLSLVGLPYACKFLWAPWFDKIILPFWDRRRSWILIWQIALIIGITIMAIIDPNTFPFALALAALFVAFCSASQDIVIDAYRTDILLPEERGISMGFFIGAYRIAMLIAGSISFIIADFFGWHFTYALMAFFMLCSIFATKYGQKIDNNISPPKSIKEAYLLPLNSFLKKDGSIFLVLVVLTYKFADVFAMKLMTTFFIRGLDFSLSEIGTVNKFVGFFSMLFGVFVGGLCLKKWHLYKVLLWFGVFQLLSNLCFIWLAIVGKNMPVFIITIVCEQFFNGMGNAAFVALLMALCDIRFTAAHYAFLSALSAVPREVLGPLSAYLVNNFGWLIYYKIAFLSGIPGLFLLVFSRRFIPEK